MVMFWNKPSGHAENDFILIWNDKILLDIAKEIENSGTLKLYVGHTGEKSSITRLIGVDYLEEVNEPRVAEVSNLSDKVNEGLLKSVEQDINPVVEDEEIGSQTNEVAEAYGRDKLSSDNKTVK